MIKGIKDSPETVGAQGGMLGDGVDVESASLHNLEWGGVDLNLQGVKNRNQPAWKTIPKESWCRCAAALTMGYQLNHVCNKPKAFELERTQHDVITWLFHFEETLNTGKPFTQKSFSRNNLRVERKTPSLALGKVTLPRGKLECRSYMLRPRETNTDCGPWCSAAQKGEWLCRVQAQGEHN